MNKARYILLFSLFCILFAGCERPNLYSYRKDHEIVIDGQYADWGNYTSYYNEKEKITVNLANDDEYLYLCLISRSRRVETMSRQPREATNKILELVEEGLLNKDTVILACLKYMSEQDVANMVHANEFILEEEEQI